MKKPLLLAVISFVMRLSGTATAQENAIPVEEKSVQPGTSVMLKGEEVNFYEGPLIEVVNALAALE